MLNATGVAAFELFQRVPTEKDEPGRQYPHMQGHLDRRYQLRGMFVINEETGQKYLDLIVLDEDSAYLTRGRLFRDCTVHGRPQYTGFLRAGEVDDPNGFTSRSLQIELTAELGSVDKYPGGSHIAGRAYLPQHAAKHSYNRVLRESDLPF